MGVKNAAVFPLVRTRAFAQPFDYRVPDHLVAAVEVGSLVAAPLGPRTVLGLVVSVAATTHYKRRIRRLKAVVELPPVPRDLVQLGIRVQF